MQTNCVANSLLPLTELPDHNDEAIYCLNLQVPEEILDELQIGLSGTTCTDDFIVAWFNARQAYKAENPAMIGKHTVQQFIYNSKLSKGNDSDEDKDE